MVIGGYGKLPLCGDFTSLGDLDGAFPLVREWLHSAFGAAQRLLPEGWDTAYRTAPIWRFAAGAGVFSPRAVVGVLSPSVDRVGRLFPLVLICDRQEGSGWYEAAENLLLDMFGGRLTDIADFDSRLRRLAADGVDLAHANLHCPDLSAAHARLGRFSIWWAPELSDGSPRRTRVFEALPAGVELAAMLGSDEPIHRDLHFMSNIAGGGPAAPCCLGAPRCEDGPMLVLFGERTLERSSLLEAAQIVPATDFQLAWLLALAETLDADIRRMDDDLYAAGQARAVFAGMAVVWNLGVAGLAVAMTGSVVVLGECGGRDRGLDGSVHFAATRVCCFARATGAKIYLGGNAAAVAGGTTNGGLEVAAGEGISAVMSGPSLVLRFVG
jgi:type VI secretion system protein ImpM